MVISFLFPLVKQHWSLTLWLCLILQQSISQFLSIRTEMSKKKKWSRYRPGVAQRMGRGIALLFHDRDTRSGWLVSSTPRPHFTPGKDPVPISQEAGWVPGPVWTGWKLRPYRDSIPDRPAHGQSLCRLSYLAHTGNSNQLHNMMERTDSLATNHIKTTRFHNHGKSRLREFGL